MLFTLPGISSLVPVNAPFYFPLADLLIFRGTFRSFSDIYDGAFFENIL